MPTMFQAPLVAGSWDFRRCGAFPPQEELLGCPFTSGGFLGSSAGHTSFDVPMEALPPFRSPVLKSTRLGLRAADRLSCQGVRADPLTSLTSDGKSSPPPSSR